MGFHNPVPRTLFDLSATSTGTTITASGNSGPAAIDLLDVTDVTLLLTVGTPTGTSPSLTVQLDVLDPDGNWIPAVTKTAALTTAGTAAAFAGLHVPNAGPASSPFVLPRWARIAWTVVGTTPAFPQVSLSLTGR